MTTPTHPVDDQARPPMVEAVLNADTLGQLFYDIRACAAVTRILVRPSHANATPRELPAGELDQVHDGLLDGSVRLVQLRYTHAGQQWIDTIQQKQDTLKLVRIQVPTQSG